MSTDAMLDRTTFIVATFFLCATIVGFAYVGYPILIWTLARIFGRNSTAPSVESADLPSVSLLIVAHNEESDIDTRVRNALSLHYPPDKLEIVIASDGSTDATNEIVERYAEHGVQLVAYPTNRGKAAVLNESIPHLRGEVVILSDANTQMDPNAIRALATWFADPGVGVVCGKLVLIDSRSGRNVDGLYWKYETFLKKSESRLGALLGCNGANYAFRKSLFAGIPADTAIDDFVLPLEIRRRSGCRIQYDAQALAFEETPPDISSEFRRRSRIGAGGFQSIGRLWPLLSPRHGWICLTFFAHKLLRWLSPFCLVGMLVLNVMLLTIPGFAYLLGVQAAFYATAAIAPYLPRKPRVLRLLNLTTMFAAMNLALLVGFMRWVTGTQQGKWQRTRRAHVAPREAIASV
jgi:cellulose synthase/poly-beta-1,6-N-acetylglucosamine synthase-like glycosyltransferase